ncbi:MAG: hypothetical protein A3H35_08540 [Betaproteobacteria bacterium RIFCSPLOWO2_02_FULL_62_17]|nr:MAG: hypothetical protein A3H35_08540 [Betaproteobacteria bacterium RIFCSPLOWO2_02_FULL_62_17]
MQAGTKPLPWYREPWPWLLMVGPAAVIIAGIATMALAIRSDDGLVAEDYYKRGLAINQVLAREQRARALNIAAQVDFAGGKVGVAMSADTVLPPTLRLRIVHPTRAGEDRDLLLVAWGGNLYAGELPSLSHEARRLILEDPAGTWRIAGDLDKNGGGTRLDSMR